MNRREFLSAATFGAAALACAGPEPDVYARGITITGVEVFPLRVNEVGPWVVIRVQTSVGLTGLGDASHSGRDDPSIAKVKEYVERIQGWSVFDLEKIKQEFSPEWEQFRRATSCAWSAIEQALFDIQGQALGVPCYELFGGKLFDQVRNYANINRGTRDRTPAGFVKNAESAVEYGFDALKMASFDGMPRNGTTAEREAHIQLGFDCARAVREVLGPDRDLLIDAHNQFSKEEGIALMQRLEPLRLYWLEEISRPYELMTYYTANSLMPIAGGESLYMLDQFAPYILQRCAHILMPDVKYCGGMRELKRISVLGETEAMQTSPHGPATPIGNMSAAHVCVTMKHFGVLEFSHSDAPWRTELVDPPEPMANGRLTVPDTPGLGYKLNEKTIKDRLLA